MKVIIVQWGKQQNYSNNNSIEQCLWSLYCGQGMIKIREIILFTTERNAIKFPTRKSAFLSSFCCKPVGEIV